MIEYFFKDRGLSAMGENVSVGMFGRWHEPTSEENAAGVAAYGRSGARTGLEDANIDGVHACIHGR